MEYEDMTKKELLKELKKFNKKDKDSFLKKESEKLCDQAFYNSSIPKALKDLKGRIIEVNDSFCRLLGYSRNELVFSEIEDYLYTKDIKNFHKYVIKLLDGDFKKDSVCLEKRFIRKDKNIVFTKTNIILIKNSSAEPKYLMGEIEDITEWKKNRQIT